MRCIKISLPGTLAKQIWHWETPGSFDVTIQTVVILNRSRTTLIVVILLVSNPYLKPSTAAGNQTRPVRQKSTLKNFSSFYQVNIEVFLIAAQFKIYRTSWPLMLRVFIGHRITTDGQWSIRLFSYLLQKLRTNMDAHVAMGQFVPLIVEVISEYNILYKNLAHC